MTRDAVRGSARSRLKRSTGPLLFRRSPPRELYRAQGFPDDYVIEGVWREKGGDWHWTPFPKDVQVSCCGNAVCPPLAEALVRANCGHLAAGAERAVA